MKKPLLVLLLTFTLVLAACTSNGISPFKEGIAEFISNNYPIYDTVSSATNSSNFSEIYIAENQTIDEVVSTITTHEQPGEMSEKKDGKQVLVYGYLFVIATIDEENPSNTYIEIAKKEFVRDNYRPSFFNGLFLGWMLSDLFGMDNWGKSRNQQCQQNPSYCYGGYGTSGGGFKGKNETPTIRGGSSSVRGGGPGAGK
jgi:hypothetical protein